MKKEKIKMIALSIAEAILVPIMAIALFIGTLLLGLLVYTMAFG